MNRAELSLLEFEGVMLTDRCGATSSFDSWTSTVCSFWDSVERCVASGPVLGERGGEMGGSVGVEICGLTCRLSSGAIEACCESWNKDRNFDIKSEDFFLGIPAIPPVRPYADWDGMSNFSSRVFASEKSGSAGGSRSI